MQIQNLFKPFEIEYFKVDECPCKPHKHTFFELVYINSGRGMCIIDGNKFAYRPGDLFIIVPNNGHHTIVQSTTEFVFVRFNNIFIRGQSPALEHSNLGDWIKKLEVILTNQTRSIALSDKKYNALVSTLFKTLIDECRAPQDGAPEITQQMINTLLTLLARSIPSHSEATDRSLRKLDILQYIHQNIYNPVKIKAESIAGHFNISANYFSEYFKKNFNTSLQEYILNYKITLAEIRMRHTDMTLSEIAHELNFSDQSHLSKIFKKIRKISPSLYRQQFTDLPQFDE